MAIEFMTVQGLFERCNELIINGHGDFIVEIADIDGTSYVDNAEPNFDGKALTIWVG